MSVKEQVRRFLLDEVFHGAAADELTDDADLLALGMDSMALLRLTVFLEEDARRTGQDDPGGHRLSR